MNKLWTIAPALALLATGCGGNDRADTVPDRGSENPAEVQVKAEVTLTAAQTKDALLTLEDVPTGMSVVPPRTDPEPKITPSVCSGLGPVSSGGDPAAEAVVTYTGGDWGPELDQSVASWPTSPDSVMDKVHANRNKCTKFTSTASDGTKGTFQVSGLSFPNLGDRTVAMRMTGQFDGQDFTVDNVVIAVGRNTITLQTWSVFPSQVDLEALAGVAVERLDAAATN